MDSPLLNQDSSYWRRNLAIIWLSQFITYVGFDVALPFTPFYMRECLEVPETMLRTYVGMSSAFPSLLLAIMAPIWGLLADRLGRKLMILRANYLGGVVFALMGLSPQLARLAGACGMSFVTPVGVFLTLRLLQGIFTGTTSAAMTLVSSSAPRERQGYALAILSTAIYSGEIGGMLLGGYLSEIFGYQKSFYLCGATWIFSGIFVHIFAVENFKRPLITAVKAKNELLTKLNIVVFPALPLFLTYILSSFARFLDSSQLPLVIEQLNGGPAMPYAARWTSIILAAGFIGAMLSGTTVGRLIDRNAKLVFSIAAACGGLLMLSILIPLVTSFGQSRMHLSLPGLPSDGSTSMIFMLAVRFGIVFCSATFEPVLNSWLSKITTPENKGNMFGSAVTFRSGGAVITHSMAAFLATNWGFRSLYIFGPCCYAIIIPVIFLVERRLHNRLI